MPHNRRSPCLIALALFTACGAPTPDAPGDAATPDDSGLPGGYPPRRLGDTIALTTTGHLVSFDRSAPGTLLTNVLPGWFARDERVVAIDMRPRDRALYALTNHGQLYVVDTGWGLARPLLQVTGLVGADVEIDFDPVLDRLHVVSGDGTRLVVDVDAGHVDTVTDTVLAGIAFANNFASACRSTQYVIDPAGDLQVIRGTAATRIGALGLGATHVAFDIATDSAGADAAFAVDGAGFYAVDLATGHASLREVVPLSAGEAITGLALAVSAVAPAQPPVSCSGSRR
jgi:hypothetical protein